MKNEQADQEVSPALSKLEYLLQTVPALLHAIAANEFDRKPPGKWSKKEILGHLVDSANHNHHRFVRSQFEEAPLIRYEQDAWVTHNYYQHMDRVHLIDLWRVYNTHLLQLMSLMPREKLERVCHTGNSAPHTLAFLLVDYVNHLEHHLGQLLNNHEIQPQINPPYAL